MDDKEIVGLFLERSEQAIEAVTKQYGKMCHHIARNILPSDHDAEECVCDAYLKLWNTIPPEKPKSLRSYLTRVLRNLAYDRRDKQTAQRRDDRLTVCLQELESCLPPGSMESVLDSCVIRDTLNAFLRALPKNDRFLFIHRYYYLGSCRQQLKEMLLKEGIYV